MINTRFTRIRYITRQIYHSSSSNSFGRWYATNFTPSFPRVKRRVLSGLLNCCQMTMQMQAENMNRRKKIANRRIETVVIQGVNLLMGEKRMLGLAMFSEMQYPRRRGAPIWIQDTSPTFTKKDVIFDLLLYWSRRSQRLMFMLTSSSRKKLRQVSASSIEEIFQHCSCELGVENEHSIFQVQKLVSRSSLNLIGKITNCDSRLSLGFILEEGITKLSHRDPLSLVMTSLEMGMSHLVLSSEVSIGFSQNLIPFLYPLAFCSSYPPSWSLSSFPPGVVQKLTMSSLKYSVVWPLMS